MVSPDQRRRLLETMIVDVCCLDRRIVHRYTNAHLVASHADSWAVDRREPGSTLSGLRLFIELTGYSEA